MFLLYLELRSFLVERPDVKEIFTIPVCMSQYPSVLFLTFRDGHDPILLEVWPNLVV